MHPIGLVLLCFVIFICFRSTLQVELESAVPTRSLLNGIAQATSPSSWMSTVTLVAIVEGADGEPEESSVSTETETTGTQSSTSSFTSSSSSSQCGTTTAYDLVVECYSTAPGRGTSCFTTSTSKTIGCSPTTTITYVILSALIHA
jgi:hypothetical protein